MVGNDAAQATARGGELFEIPLEAYVSRDYLRDEQALLWGRAWQLACREEDIPEVGDFHVHDVMDHSAIVMRSAPDEVDAWVNACRHRGRRLAEGDGTMSRIACRYHAWQWSLRGEIANVPSRGDWGGSLDGADLDLVRVRTGRWGGFVFVNFDPGCEPLEDYLERADSWLAPFELGRMRYAWRRWTRLHCNWKVAQDAFIETYHAAVVHPQNRKYGSGRSSARAEGRHTCLGTVGREGAGLGTSIDTSRGRDQRKAALGLQRMMMDTIKGLTTQTFVDAAGRLDATLPETADAAQVSTEMRRIAREMDEARGVEWPDIADAHLRDAGFAWHLFPNTIVEPGISFALVMRFLPDGDDPDRSVFEAFALERMPGDHAQRVTNDEVAPDDEATWGLLWVQDFLNLPAVQQGMKCPGATPVRPNPVLEGALFNFHANLADYMGRGGPRPA